MLRPAVSARYGVLALWSAVCAWRAYTPRGDWDLLVSGSQLLVGIHAAGQLPSAMVAGRGGVHLYADHPWIQVGPPALLVSAVLRHVGPNSGLVAAAAVIASLGLAVVWLIEQVARSVRPPEDELLFSVTVLLGGLVVVGGWSLLVHYGHLEDAMAIAATVGAMWMLVKRRPMAVGLLVGLAVATKPWAIVFAPLLLAVERRDRRRAVVGAAAVVAVCWLPFVIGDRTTLRELADLRIVVADASLLALFNVVPYAPRWIRPLQALAGTVVAVIVVRRGRWWAVLLAASAVRLAIDPQTFGYYSAGLLAGALVWDLVGWHRPVPVLTFVVFGLMNVGTDLVDSYDARAVLRLLAEIACVVFALAAPTRAANGRSRAG